MWIALAVILLIGAILLLPIHIFLSNEEGEFFFIVEVLGIRVAEFPSESQKKDENYVTALLKKAFGLNKDEKSVSDQEDDEYSKKPSPSISETLRILGNVFTEAKAILNRIRIKRLNLNIKCTGEDAAQSAIKYGAVCAVAYPVLGLIHSNFKISKRGEKVEILCDYDGTDDSLSFSALLSVAVGTVLTAAIKVIIKEVKEKINTGE